MTFEPVAADEARERDASNVGQVRLNGQLAVDCAFAHTGTL